MSASSASQPSAPVRPKVGRMPPPSITARPGADALSLQFGGNERWDGRFAVYALALIGALALLTGSILHGGGKKADTVSAVAPPSAPAPAAASATVPVAVKTQEGQLVGQVSRTEAPPDSTYYPTAAQQPQPQTQVDKDDRKRLLSIISNY